jgi:recombination protein RecA
MRAESSLRLLDLPQAAALSPNREQALLRIRKSADWAQPAPVPRTWSYRTCAGRLIELSGTRTAPLLTLAFALVLDAQRAGEPVAWVQGVGSTFFPPDAARNGIDLKSLAVVRLPPAGLARAGLVRAAARLLRSGAFGLIALDLGGDAGIPDALLGKLGQLAQQHDTAVCCLTVKRPERPSLGSLVSLRGEATRKRQGEDRFSCVMRVLKDKRNGPGWTHEEVAHGAPGLP